MSYSFDLLQEPWIPVVDATGQKLYMGIWDVLQNAHELQGIMDASPLVEYGLHRLLCVFLMDALRPEEDFDIEDLLNEGAFDMEKIQDYVDRCHREGASFDLFDEKRPFLQTPYVAAWDGEPKPVGYLDCMIPTGGNHTHFNHLERSGPMSYGEAARHLPSCSLFITAAAQGYPSGPNGAPPYFTLIKGGNLFQTLVNTLVPVSEIDDFDSIGPCWRSHIVVEPKKKVGRTSWLYGMLFPSRRVLLIPEEDGIRKIYYRQGINFCVPESWKDPHVTYVHGKKGAEDKRFPWRPNSKTATWRNLNNLVSVQNGGAPKIVELYTRRDGVIDAGQMHILLYGLETEKAALIDAVYHDLQIPVALTRDNRALLVGQCIEAAEELAKNLAYSLRVDGVSPGIAKDASQMCYNECEKALWSLCREELSAAGQVDGAKVLSKWKLKLYAIGKDVVAEMLKRVSLTGQEWLKVYRRQGFLNKKLIELKKEGENANGGAGEEESVKSANGEAE